MASYRIGGWPLARVTMIMKGGGGLIWFKERCPVLRGESNMMVQCVCFQIVRQLAVNNYALWLNVYSLLFKTRPPFGNGKCSCIRFLGVS